ncbi:MFS transporter, MHS family, proline/betaine transporter [Desulfotomaculum arcticum]|uniref:Putative proline/betaine transporter n=1 Tax=Desulfotruncus arcticus DSM 17038 TaxID=1121424 RepID=A0A1I2UP29_9FIRM|nr:MFS transporter [Desulfotruncus arcticus]SFG78783.1 MFS transporter, MHS family, proline/betaine transporter [Desulfotomaculum arcticum] [Desulfotruncus arcticus DSM 17038]
MSTGEKKKTFLGAVIAGSAGNIMEWFDYSLYAYFASAISINFFPADDPLVSLILAFVVFGAGFVARPLGGFIFGHYADKIGRKHILGLTVMLMGGSTFIMGILPTYAQIGIAAPIILTAVRLLQGLAAGGEWGSCVSFLGEYAKPDNRAYIVSFGQVGAAFGLLMGVVFGMFLSSVMSAAVLNAWGWRIAFVVGILVAWFGYYITKKIDETPVFQEQQKSDAPKETPLFEIFRNYKKPMITVFLLMCGGNITYWLIMTFMATYISRFLKLSLTTGFSLTALTIIVYMIGLPVGGRLADKYGRKPLMLTGSAGIAVLGYPLFKVLAQANSYFEMASIVCVLAFVFALFQGSNTVAMSELFPTAVRVSGFSVPYQLSSAVFAGTVMAAVTWLLKVTGDVMVVPVYMCLSMVVTLLTVIILYPETKDKPF